MYTFAPAADDKDRSSELLENKNNTLLTKTSEEMAQFQFIDITSVSPATQGNGGKGGRKGGRKSNPHNDEPRMTSVEIAQVTGKLHKVVLAAIRNMEPAWTRVSRRWFDISEYRDSRGRLKACYSLTKAECLYVATKFNDEARARLVLRWEELERLSRQQAQHDSLKAVSMTLQLQKDTIDLQQQQLTLMAPKAEYCDEVLSSCDCYTTTQVAKELSMTVFDLIKWLISHGIIYFESGQYMLYGDLARKGYARTRTHIFYDLERTKHTKTYLVWTELGRCFIHRFMKIVRQQENDRQRQQFGLTDEEIIDRV